jgi:hypothetical protein
MDGSPDGADTPEGDDGVPAEPPSRRTAPTLHQIAALEDRIGALMGTINTATAALVAVIAEVLETGAWCGWGVRSPEHWVAWRCGVSRHRARRLVRLARRRAELPTATAAFASGSLTEDQAHVVARRVPAALEAEVSALAPRLTVGQLERSVAHLPPIADPRPGDGADAAPPGDAGTTHDVSPFPERREVAFGFDDDGTWRLRAVLPPDEGALVARALERARDQAFDVQGAAVDWADGLVGAAEAALVELERERTARRSRRGRTRRGANRGRPGHRYQVLVHVPADAVAGTGTHLHLGPPLPPAVRRYLSCDATYRIAFERAGSTVTLSSLQRTVDDRLRTIVEERDRGCRVPGCAQTRWLHVHHLQHYEDGGPTEEANLCCLCPYHHRMHHRGVLGITGDPTRPDGLIFTDRHGRRLDRAPPRTGVDIGLGSPRWQSPSGERMDHRALDWDDPAA